MINLLPNDYKQSIRYARLNTQLLHWLGGMLVGISGIALVVIGGQLYIKQSVKTYRGQVSQLQSSLANQKMADTQKRVEDISSSFKLVNQVLSKEILFSRLLQQIGAVMPPGSSLQGLSIGSLEGGIDLQAVASDYQTATQVQVNLQDPANQIFEKADILSIACSTTKATDPRYPCQVTIRALFAKNNPFTFVKPTETKR